MKPELMGMTVWTFVPGCHPRMVSSQQLQLGRFFGNNRRFCRGMTGSGTKCCLKKISICNWKAWFNSLAVDERVQEKGISLASACDCCSPPGRESIDHILATGNIAAQIWDHASKLLNVPCLRFDTWKAKLSAWMIMAKKASLSGNLIGLLPCIITWCLWNSRCKARMEGLKASVEQVWRSVKMWLKSLATELKVLKNLSDQDVRLMTEFNLVSPKAATVRKCRLVQWLKPPCGWVKINCDGSVRNNPGSSGGGGILRDANGDFQGAFSSHYGIGSNNRAELRALFDGIQLCKRLSYFNVIIESDSKTIVDWFRAGRCTLWYLWDFWDECFKDMIMCIIFLLSTGSL